MDDFPEIRTIFQGMLTLLTVTIYQLVLKHCDSSEKLAYLISCIIRNS